MTEATVKKSPLPAFVEAVLPLPLRRSFTYRVPEPLRSKIGLGARLLLPFGKRSLTGYAVGLHDNPAAQVSSYLAIWVSAAMRSASRYSRGVERWAAVMSEKDYQIAAKDCADVLIF